MNDDREDCRIAEIEDWIGARFRSCGEAQCVVVVDVSPSVATFGETWSDVRECDSCGVELVLVDW